MNPTTPVPQNPADLTGMIFGFLFTLMIFSYILGDNPLFRLALYIFIGVATGYAVAVVALNVIWNQLILPLYQNPGKDTFILLLPPMAFGLWLLTKSSGRMSRLGNPVMAYLVGAGAATAIGGAILGTVFPQVGSTAAVFDPQVVPFGSAGWTGNLLRSGLILIGTVVTLLFFQFGVRSGPDQVGRRPIWLELLAKAGMVFIAITFGIFFASAYSAVLTALVERIRFLLDTILTFVPLR